MNYCQLIREVNIAGYTIDQLPFGQAVGQLAGQRPYTGQFSTKCTIRTTYESTHLHMYIIDNTYVSINTFN